MIPHVIGTVLAFEVRGVGAGGFRSIRFFGEEVWVVYFQTLCCGVKGEGSLTQQVRDKTSVLLGAPTSYKKKLNNMYDFRSRLVHGDLDFPGRHNLREEQEGEHIQELQEAIGLAIAILIATLQEIILRNWNGIDFTYIVNDKH